MDYSLDRSEQLLVDWIADVAAKLEVSARDGDDWDADVDAELARPPASTDSLLHRLLIVEHAAEAGLPALPGPRWLVAPDVPGAVRNRPVAVVPPARSGPVRLPPSGGILLGFEGTDGWVAELDASHVAPVASSSGYPFVELGAFVRTPLAAGTGTVMRARWYLSLAAEIAGTARGGLRHTACHLDSREQFGRPLSTFQALRHRLAELAVTTEALTWMTREAAWRGDLLSAGAALGYARDAAAAMAPELVQLSGARGFTLEFPVHRFAMRLEALRLEAGAADRVAATLWTDLLEAADD